jgi:hypothetical protein
MSQLKIGSTEAYTFYEGPDFLTLTHEDSITKYKAELADFLPEEIHSMLNSSIYDSLRQGWWRDRLSAMSKGVTAFREEIREGAALITEYDLFEPTPDSDGDPIPSKYLACLFSSHPLYWSVETNNRFGSICPFHKCQSLWWEASKVDDVFGEDQCQNEAILRTTDDLIVGGAVPNNQKYFYSPIPMKLWDMMEYVFIKM